MSSITHGRAASAQPLLRSNPYSSGLFARVIEWVVRLENGNPGLDRPFAIKRDLSLSFFGVNDNHVAFEWQPVLRLSHQYATKFSSTIQIQQIAP